MRARALTYLAATAAGALIFSTGSARAAPSYTVHYRSATSVYLDGGRAQGLSLHDRLLVFAEGDTVAELEVVYLAERSASCRVVHETRPVRVGDTAVPVAKEAATVPSEPSPAPLPPARRAADVAPASGSVPASRGEPLARVRGGISLGYYRAWDTSLPGLDFEQRTGRFDLKVWDIGGRPLSFNVRFRARQDIRSRTQPGAVAPSRQRTDRLYELSVRYEPTSERVAGEVGRIATSPFVGIGYLDGALARVQLVPGLQLGGFLGRQADVGGPGLEGSGGKYGGFVRFAPAGEYARGGGEAVLGFVRELSEGDVSREYLTLESRFGSGARWSVFQRAELDLNRGWRRELAGQAYQLSNVSLASRLRLSPATSVTVSYDSRKNYRDLTNRDVPETVFDRLLRQGLRGTVSVEGAYGLSLSAGGGVRFDGGDRANAYSWNASLRHGRASGLILGVDGSGFWNGFTTGWQASGRAGRRFGRHVVVDASYGRSAYRVAATGEQRATQWLRFTGRGELGRGVFLLADLEHNGGDDLQGPRGLFELGYRF